MVSDHSCIRVFKQAYALKEKGYRVDLVAKGLPAIGHNIYNSVTLAADDEQIKRSIENSTADIFHVHNEPDTLVGLTREATEKPIVFDIHDLSTLRWGGEQEAEKIAFSASNAFIHVSEPIREFAENIYGSSKPTRVIYSFVNENWLEEPTDVGFSTVVYEGILFSGYETPPGYTVDPVVSGIRNLLKLAEELNKNKIGFHCFAANEMVGFEYGNRGAVVFSPIPYMSLLAALRNYGMGFVGAFESVPLMQMAMPNKLFEYMSQGVVPVVYNSREVAKYVTDNECGIVLESLDNLNDVPELARKIRPRVLELRHELTMEKQIDKVEELYQEII